MVLEREEGVLRIEGHLDGILLLEQHRLEQVGRLLGQDERGVDVGLALRFILYQLVGVGSDEGERRGAEVDEDAVHDGTQLVVGRGENRLVDAVDQHVDVELELLLLGAERRNGGIAHGAGAGNRQGAALPVDFDFPALVVHVDGQRQLGELLQRVEHQFARGGDGALALDAVDRDGADERGFEVRGGDFQFVAVELHEEVVENRQRILVADDLARGCEQREQGRT